MTYGGHESADRGASLLAPLAMPPMVLGLQKAKLPTQELRWHAPQCECSQPSPWVLPQKNGESLVTVWKESEYNIISIANMYRYLFCYYLRNSIGKCALSIHIVSGTWSHLEVFWGCMRGNSQIYPITLQFPSRNVNICRLSSLLGSWK